MSVQEILRKIVQTSTENAHIFCKVFFQKYCNCRFENCHIMSVQEIPEEIVQTSVENAHGFSEIYPGTLAGYFLQDTSLKNTAAA